MATTGMSYKHYCQPLSHGTLLVLVMSGLLYAVHWFVYYAIDLCFTGTLRIILDCTHYALWVLLPVTGWVAESWLGRYRAIVIGLIMSTATLPLLHVAFVMLHLDWTPIPALVLTITAFTFLTLGGGSFYTQMLPFTLDQMIGASAEHLSAVVQWYCWGFTFSLLLKDIFLCVPIPTQLLSFDILTVILLVLGSLSLSAVLVMDCLCHKWLDTRDKTGNPIKLIFRVLNYARKNKYPQLRSAFTYIDQEQPSRLDFGKHKFGGPFTEEEVEDVKTIFRIIPLLVAALGPGILSLELYDQLGLHTKIAAYAKMFECMSDFKITLSYALFFIMIPVYRFIVHPLIGKYLPSMLRITGVGLFLCLVSTVLSLAVTSIGHFQDNASHCIFNKSGAAGTIPIPIHWVLIIDVVNGVGNLFVLCFLYEFIMAQSPDRMRGIMIGLSLTVLGSGGLGNIALAMILRHYPTATPSCVFYYYLVLSLLMLLILVVYVVLARCYKLRERERHINIQAIVEEHYEKYIDQEEEFLKQRGDDPIISLSCDTDNCSVT